ncbi:MAG: hypothetical protein ACU0BF_06940 [Paracoccaceae bacterium]
MSDAASDGDAGGPGRGAAGATGAPPSLALHIGLHKTATTHLQSNLKHNAGTFARHGVRVLTPWDMRRPGRRVPELLGIWGDGSLAKLADGASRVVLSEENFIGTPFDSKGRLRAQPYPRVVKRLRGAVAAVSPAPVQLFMGLRHPVPFVLSCYSQTLLSGNRLSMFDFAAALTPDRVDWTELVERILSVEGIETLHVWRQEDYPAVLRHVLRRMTRWKLGGLSEIDEAPRHPGLSARAVEAVLYCGTDEREEVERLAHEARDAYPIGPDWPKFDPWAGAGLEEVTARYDAQIAAIGRMDRVKLIRPPRDAST